MSPNPKNQPKGPTDKTSFTIEEPSRMSEVPGVTKLLNRKSFAKTTPSPTETKAAPQRTSLTVRTKVQSLKLEAPVASLPSEGPASAALSTIQKTARRRSGPVGAALQTWSLSELESSPDPMGKALAGLISKGVTQALFLAVQAPSTKGGNPTFAASAAFNAGNKAAIWTGLCWDPTVLPDVWSQLVGPGYVELPEPGTMTNFQSARNISRAAFDTGNDEILLLARVGTTQQCRGILVLISRKPVLSAVKQAMPSLSMAPYAMKKSA